VVARPQRGRPENSSSAGDGDDANIASALASLDPRQRDVLCLYAWAELSHEEIADSLGIPLGTVRSRLARARAHLKAELRTPRRAELAPATDTAAQEER
jgi:RNA polymerase sigma factor (sigma-70 family)